jgi:hypothetical protein
MDDIRYKALLSLNEIRCRQLVYDNLFYSYRIKLSAMDEIITSITQKVSLLKREIEA